MSSSDRSRGEMPGVNIEPAPAGSSGSTTDTSDPYAHWLDRMQRAKVRHAAITRNLYTWSNYKNWADRMKDSWEEEQATGNGAGAPNKLPRR